MRTLGNILWHFPCGGFITAGGTFLLGVLLTGTVVAAPIGLGLIQFSKFLLAPFGQTMIRKSTLGVEQNRAWLAYSWLVTIIYFPFGLLCAAALAVEVALLCLTIIGIPLALIVAKFIGTYFNPVNKICVSTKVAEELSRRAALEYIEQKAAPRPALTPPVPAVSVSISAVAAPAFLASSAEPDTAVGEATPDSPVPEKWQAIQSWLRHPLHAAQAAAWGIFSIAVMALLFALGRTSAIPWPFWLSLAILPPASYLALRGNRTQGVILLCAAPLLALIFILRGVGQRPQQIPLNDLAKDAGAGWSTGTSATTVAATPPPVAPQTTPLAASAPEASPGGFDAFLNSAVEAMNDEPPPPASSLRVEADAMDEETRMETIWVIAPDGAKTKLTTLLHLRDSRVSPTGDNIAVQERGSKDHDLVRVFSRQGSGYEERSAGIDYFEAISREAGLPEGENLDSLYISIVKWESAGRLRIRADGKRRGKFFLRNWQGFLDIHPDETAMMPDPAHKAAIESMETVAESAPPPSAEDALLQSAREFIAQHHQRVSIDANRGQRADLDSFLNDFADPITINGTVQSRAELREKERADMAGKRYNQEAVRGQIYPKLSANGEMEVAYRLHIHNIAASGKQRNVLVDIHRILERRGDGWRIKRHNFKIVPELTARGTPSPALKPAVSPRKNPPAAPGSRARGIEDTRKLDNL